MSTETQTHEQTTMTETYEPYHKEGFAEVAVGSIITLITGVAAIVLIMIMVGTLGGKMYNITQADINAINDSTIKGYVNSAISSSFNALNQTASYVPIVVLAVITFLVLFLVLAGTGGFGGGFGGNRTAL